MATLRDVAAELIEDMGLHELDRDDVACAVFANIEVRYEDAMRHNAEHSRKLSKLRQQLCRDVWRSLDLGVYPW